jgi:hypothetical protein
MLQAVTEKVAQLTEQFMDAAKNYDSNVLFFVVAICVDKYAKFLADSVVSGKP